MGFCQSPYWYQRRKSREVVVGDPKRGGVVIGGDHPVVVQSMVTSNTMDTEATVQQVIDLVEAGCQLVRVTTPTVKASANLENIVNALRARGCQVPLVADVHFKPDAAMEAARWVEKVRINPGNYADSKKFAVREYTPEEYEAELQRIEERFVPLVQRCRELGRAMRIGTNHGSLSDRIMNYYGDTPKGMVESALEFAAIARKYDFHNFVFSMKASNPKVMIESYRLLAARLEEMGPDWNYPIHLGVTEAGEGEDGRIKSAIGIGATLADGLGDTIRVSLLEESPREIPVCQNLIAQIPALTHCARTAPELPLPFDPYEYRRRTTREVPVADGVTCGGENPPRVIVTRAVWDEIAPKIRPSEDVRPEGIYELLGAHEVDPTEDFALPEDGRLVTVRHGVGLPAIAAFRLLAARLHLKGSKAPILLKDTVEREVPPLDPETALLRSATVIGSLLADGIGDALLIRNEPGAGRSLQLAFNILQGAGSRSFRTEYVACPSCGRTLFDLPEVTARIRARTGHLKGVKIAVMGCIVNGPGEMADADFGYVGGAPGKVNLYVGKTPVKFNIPEAEAVERLVDLIKEYGKWREPDESPAAEQVPAGAS